MATTANDRWFDGAQWIVIGQLPATLVVPSAPTNLAVSPLQTQITVTCTIPASNGGAAISGYTWTLTPVAGGATQTATTSSSTLTKTWTGLTANTTYTVTVAATNVVGTGPAASTTAQTQAASTQTIKYGPDGSVYPTFTPPETNAAYATIALNDWTGLWAALRSAPSGAVVLMSNGAWTWNNSLQQYDSQASTHLKTLAQNVLIRPVTPGGVVLDNLNWALSNTTLMYWEVTTNFAAGGKWVNGVDPMNRARFARMKIGPNVQVTINGPANDTHFDEMVAPTRGSSGTDRLHWSPIPSSSTHPEYDVVDLYFNSCWFEGVDFAGGTGHVDTVQGLQFSGTNKMQNCYIGKCGNSSNMQMSPDLQGTAAPGTFIMDTCYCTVPGAFNGLLFGQLGAVLYNVAVNNCEINNFRLAPLSAPPAGTTWDISNNKFAQAVNSTFPNNTYGAVLSAPVFVKPPWAWW